jgi:hypothetical protein
VRTPLVIAQEWETSRFCSHNLAGLRVAQRAKRRLPQEKLHCRGSKERGWAILPSSRARIGVPGLHFPACIGRSEGLMNGRQKKVLIAGFLFILATGLYPPWVQSWDFVVAGEDLRFRIEARI